jgi:regulator of RNase E activity RraB
MSQDFPADSDGRALRQILSTGSDLTRPMYVNFHVATPSREAAEEVGRAASRLGYRVSIYIDEAKQNATPDQRPWTCECSTRMVLSYPAVIAMQVELAELSRPHGGLPNGWGTFGNGPRGQPNVE